MNRETYRRAFDDIPFSDDFETRTIKLLQDRARNQEKEKMTMTFSKHRKLAVTLAAAVAALAALLAPEKDYLEVDTGDMIRPPYDAVIMAEDLIEA